VPVSQRTSERMRMALQKCLAKSDRRFLLPPRKKIFMPSNDHTGWASHYGGIHNLVTYAGLLHHLPISFNATWQHGVTLESEYRNYPYSLTYGIHHPVDRKIFVATRHQQSALNAIGYSNVYITGLPYIYAERTTEHHERVTNSILAMPAHTLEDAPFENNQAIKEYCSWVAEKYSRSEYYLHACINMSCIRNNHWWPELLESDINIVGGADFRDRNSYARMHALFKQFDIITTNSVGSHVFYALAAGCKIVIEGDVPKYSNKQLKCDATHVRALNANRDTMYDEHIVNERHALTSQFCAPRTDIELGNYHIGKSNKLGPREVRSLLGWGRKSQLAATPINILKFAISSTLNSSIKGSMLIKNALQSSQP
jgi:hypothetical protein